MGETNGPSQELNDALIALLRRVPSLQSLTIIYTQGIRDFTPTAFALAARAQEGDSDTFDLVPRLEALELSHAVIPAAVLTEFIIRRRLAVDRCLRDVALHSCLESFVPKMYIPTFQRQKSGDEWGALRDLVNDGFRFTSLH